MKARAKPAKDLSWGRLFEFQQPILSLDWQHEAAEQLRVPTDSATTWLPYGAGCSYGDSCLNRDGLLLQTSGMNRILSFDTQTGILECESGCRFEDLLPLLLSHGWFLPVVPGTQYLTIGGAIANDIHGKNHHRAGTFGCHVLTFSLLRSNGVQLQCSSQENSDLFQATIGGLGLTGLILQASIQCQRTAGPLIEQETIRLTDLDHFFDLSTASDDSHEYSVAWIDCFAPKHRVGRGLFFRGNPKAGPLPEPRRQLLLPHRLLSAGLTKPTIRVFNWLYRTRQWRANSRATIPYQNFFFPLDTIKGWNRSYGTRGFFQLQFVLPEPAIDTLREALVTISESRLGSFLVVLKKFGDMASPGIMSFPMPGYTLAIDIANRPDACALISDLEQRVVAAGGRIYAAKDALMSRESFLSSYPGYRCFQQHIDPRFSSDFIRRVA